MSQDYKPKHYWAIHKRVFRHLWKELSPRQRELVSNDVEQKTETFRRFVGDVKAETERLYNDPAYKFNEPHTFKIPYYEPASEVEPAKV